VGAMHKGRNTCLLECTTRMQHSVLGLGVQVGHVIGKGHMIKQDWIMMTGVMGCDCVMSQ